MLPRGQFTSNVSTDLYLKQGPYANSLTETGKKKGTKTGRKQAPRPRKAQKTSATSTPSQLEPQLSATDGDSQEFRSPTQMPTPGEEEPFDGHDLA
jgi:hypothetical protein